MRPAESFVGQPVRSLQTMLRVIGEDDASLPSVIPDGFYGRQTRQAVEAFQRKYGIASTGVADRNTWEHIRRIYEPALIRVDQAEPLQLILNPSQVIKRGESHPYVYLIQVMLLALSEIYGSITPASMSGILDLPTSQAVSDFQFLSDLEQTGEIDKITWKHLARQYPLAVNIRMTENRTNRNFSE
jgi:peptidoglycan hydrolase-like protein with peptidoglycan-binding domain